jgi:hypothetical protein
MSQTYNYGVQKGTGSFNVLQYTDNSSGTTRSWMTSGSKGPSLSNLTDVTILGNLSVQGTTTTVDSTTVAIGDRIIELNTQPGSGDAGIYVQDADNNATGSLLYDTATSRWMGGVKGSEVDLVDLSATQTLTNKTMTSADLNTPDIDGGTIDGATIATSNVTVGAGKTLDVSAGTLTTSAAQKLAIMQGAGANVDIGTFDLRASTLTADSMTSGRVAIYGANGVLADDSDLSFSGDTLTATKIGAFEAAGAIDFSDEAMTNVNVDSGAIDGTTIGASSQSSVKATTLSGSSTLNLDGNAQFNGSVTGKSSITAGTSFIIGSADLNEADMEKLDGISDGTGAANKALVLDGSRDVDTINALGIASMANNWTNASRTVADMGVVTTMDLNGGTIDGTTIGASSRSTGAFTTVSASSHVSASALKVAGQASIEYSDALDLSIGSTKYAALSSDYFSSSVGLQGATLEVSGAASVASLNVNDGNITNVGSIALDSITADDGSSFSMGSNWTAASRTCADLGSVTTADINGGSIDGATIGAASAAAGTFTTVSAGTSLALASGATVTGIADEDGMGSNSATLLATQQSIKAYVDAQVTAQDLDFQGDSGGALNIDLDSETLDIAGGTNVTTVGSGNTLTVNLDAALSGLTTVDGSGDLTMGTITMSGFSVDADGDTSAKSLISTSTISGSGAITGASTAAFAGNVSTQGSFVIGNASMSEADLEQLDGISAGTAAASKAVVLDVSKNIATIGTVGCGAITSTGNSSFAQITLSSNLVANGNVDLGSDTSDSVTFNGLLDSDIVPDATGNSRKLGSSTKKFSAVYATNVYTGDMHLKNERGDWTIFEESDHLRIRNNATGQTFKMAMTPIEEE